MNDRQVAFRLPADLVDRIDEKAHALRKQTPGMRVTRADVVRSILVRGLDESEQASLDASASAERAWASIPQVSFEEKFAPSLARVELNTGLETNSDHLEDVVMPMSMDED